MKKHAKTLIELIRRTVGEPNAGAEVGVWRGSASIALLQAFDHLRLTMVDRYERYGTNDPDGVMRGKSQAEMLDAMREVAENTMFAADRRLLVVGDSVVASKLVRDNCLDFVFIDGNHSYESVSCDVAHWWYKLRWNGLFCGHDYDGRGDRTGRFGVQRAVDEWAARTGCKIEVAPCRIWWTIKK